MKRSFSMFLCLALVGACSVGASTVLADHGGDDKGAGGGLQPRRQRRVDTLCVPCLAQYETAGARSA